MHVWKRGACVAGTQCWRWARTRIVTTEEHSTRTLTTSSRADCCGHETVPVRRAQIWRQGRVGSCDEPARRLPRLPVLRKRWRRRLRWWGGRGQRAEVLRTPNHNCSDLTLERATSRCLTVEVAKVVVKMRLRSVPAGCHAVGPSQALGGAVVDVPSFSIPAPVNSDESTPV